ncbi:MAG: hypothetical protein M1835_007500 [Candelina submexicana]|nr:MAG: hypothetical protein M1835_007500 [Candelina submexicana]
MAQTESRLSEPVGENYRWLLTSTERNHIGQLLDVAPSTIPTRGNVMTRERDTCKHCGKHSGLDDLVHNALDLQIHSPEFMLDILRNGPTNDSPGHELKCSGCGEMFDGLFRWGGFWADM